MRVAELTKTAVAIAAALTLSSCGGGAYGGGDQNPSAPSGSASVVVSIGAGLNTNAFNPNPVPATVGQTVAFKNNDSVTHRIVLDNGSVDLGDLPPGATSRAFSVSAGSGNFHCTLHPTMVGAINGPLPPEPPCDPSYGYC